MKTLKIDGNKLDKILNYKNLTRIEVSKEIGRWDGYISSCIRHGDISEPSMLLLEKVFGINREDIISEGKEEQAETSENNELYKIIYSAVYEAVKKAIKEI